jgi:single-strand DNA-binding protein
MLSPEVMEMTGPQTDSYQGVNSVMLRGRVSSAPLERTLPSGDAILTFRLSVARDPDERSKRPRQSADWVDCVAWSGRIRRVAGSWQVGDQVELEGSLRRRFFRTTTQTATRLEVEVMRGRRVARAVAPDE